MPLAQSGRAAVSKAACRAFKSLRACHETSHPGGVAQSVEQRFHTACVGGSSPPIATQLRWCARTYDTMDTMSNDVTEDIPVYLDAASTGVWWVTTVSGAVHIWDFDAMTITRARPNADTGMRWDGDPVSIVTVIEYPRIGMGFGVVLDTPGADDMVTIRTSSDVLRIERSPS